MKYGLVWNGRKLKSLEKGKKMQKKIKRSCFGYFLDGVSTKHPIISISNIKKLKQQKVWKNGANGNTSLGISFKNAKKNG